MVPETVIIALCAIYLGSALDFRYDVPRRIKSERLDGVSTTMIVGAGFTVLAALIADTVLVFSKLQNYDSGEFMILGLKDVNWLIIGIITLVAVLVAAALLIAVKRRDNKAA